MNSPSDYKSKFDKDLKISFTEKPENEIEAIHLFVKDSVELEKYFEKVLKVL